MHWPLKEHPSQDETKFMDELPFQKGIYLPAISEEGSTEILSSISTAESSTRNTLLCQSSSREVFMMPARQPLVAPVPPDVLSNDEKSEDVTDEEVASPNEPDADREAREKRNKHRQGCLR